MSGRRRRIALSWLVGLYAAAAVLLAPVDMLEPDTLAGNLKFAAVGVMLAAPVLLALCAVFGPWPLAIRLPLASWLACAFGLLLGYGMWRGDFGYGLSEIPDELVALCLIGPFLEFLLMLAVMSLVRAVRHWRLEAAAEPPAQTSETATPSRSTSQYTLAALLGWIVAAASIFAGLRALLNLQGAGGDHSGEALLEGLEQGAMAGIVMAVAALPVVSLAWLVLLAGRRLVLRLVLTVLTAGGMAAAFGWFWQMDQDARSLLAIAGLEAGAIAAGLGSIAVLRGCGYRLVRRPKRGLPASQPAAPEIARPQRRFSWTLAGLAAATILAACCLPARRAVWAQATETRRWAALGLEVICDGQGRAVCLQGDGERLTTDDLRRFADLPDLSMLEFESLGEAQLAAMVVPAGLETLRIADPGFTDGGLKHLAKFAQLRDVSLSRTGISDAGLPQLASLKHLIQVDLSLTDVTDDGLAPLAECRELRAIDLSMTAVTEAGAKRLSEALPEASITIGACDAVVRNAALRNSGKLRRERLHAGGKYQCIGPQKTPKGLVLMSLTDAGLKLLHAEMELKDLDLHNSAVTDAGLPVLFQLKALERVDLRDTAVSDAGRERLAKALPDCRILR